MEQFTDVVQALAQGKQPASNNHISVYESSFEQKDGTNVIMAKAGTEKYLVAAGQGELFNSLTGDTVAGGKVCGLTHENRIVLNKFFCLHGTSSIWYRNSDNGTWRSIGCGIPWPY